MSVACEGILFDGLASRGRNAEVVVGDGAVEVRCDIAAERYPYSAVTLQRSITGDFARLRLPDGIEVRIDDSEAIARMEQDLRDPQEWVRGMEARWRYALAALVVIGAAAVFGYRVMLPWAGEMVARRMDWRMQDLVGNQTLSTLDRTFCKPTRLSLPRQSQIRANAFEPLVAGLPEGDPFRITFRDCEAIGPNAFALPAKLIVVTDDLVTLAGDDDHVAAVIAHEIGHAQNHHAMRMAVQSAGVAVVIATLASDALSISNIAVLLPTVLLQTGYSREFEAEADAFAVRRLAETGKDPALFGEMLERLDKEHRRHGGNDGEQMDYLATHPATAERIARARATAAKAQAKP